MTGNPLELFRKFFGAVRAIFWLWGSFWAPDFSQQWSNDLQHGAQIGNFQEIGEHASDNRFTHRRRQAATFVQS